MNVTQQLTSAWVRRGWLARSLLPLAALHGLLVWLRRALYSRGFLKSTRIPVPVVVVGNVVAGGAGKTPLVIALVRHFQAAGFRPGVVSRGYGRSGDGCLEVLPSLSAAQTGDEPLLIRQLTGVPVFVAARRTEAALALLRLHADTDIIVCDDGLQHYALQRDLNIAVFDERGAGNGWLLPAGPLREPWPQTWAQTWAGNRAGPHAVRPVDLTLHTGSYQAFEGYTSHRTLADEALSADGRRVPLKSLQTERLTALAGIAKPQAFFDMLKDAGLQLERTLPLPDHIGLDQLAALALFAPGVVSDGASHETSQRTSHGPRVLCTQKDAVKLFKLFPNVGLQLLAVPLQFEPDPKFLKALDDRLAARSRPRTLASSQLPSPDGNKTP